MEQLIIPIFSVVFSIIGYFLKQVHSDLKKVREDLQKVVTENGKNRGRIELVEQENRLKLQKYLKIVIYYLLVEFCFMNYQNNLNKI